MSKPKTETPEESLECMEFEGKVAEWTLIILFGILFLGPMIVIGVCK